eukprot:s300_g7.t1
MDQLPTRRLQKRPTVDPSELQEWKAKAKSRVLPAESLQDGSWLLSVAEENFEVCSSMCQTQPKCPPRPLTWGSCCSGSEGVRFCAEAMNKIYEGRFGFSKILIHRYSCESNTEKQNWIAAVDRHADATMNRIQENFEARRAGSTQAEDHDPSKDAGSSDGDEHDSSESSSSSGSSSQSAASSQAREAATSDAVPDVDMGTDEPVACCIFRNILDMGSAEAECAVHKKKCPIPTVDILVVGTSCKDMSRANSTAPKSAVLRMDTSKGGSAQTFQGLLRLLDANPPAIVLFENVDAIDENKEGGESNLDIFKAETSNRGYDSQVVLTDAYEFGLPCKRRRVFILLIRTNNNILLDFHSRTLSGMFTTFGALLHGCLRSASCATDMWLPADDPTVLRELEHREEKRASERARKEKDEKEGKPITTPSTGWVDQHMQFAASLKRRWGMAPPAKLQSNRWFQVKKGFKKKKKGAAGGAAKAAVEAAAVASKGKKPPPKVEEPEDDEEEEEEEDEPEPPPVKKSKTPPKVEDPDEDAADEEEEEEPDEPDEDDEGEEEEDGEEDDDEESRKVYVGDIKWSKEPGYSGYKLQET